ncbi:PSD1 and planctomycete cytochrome C domain-containing protein [Neorhodopirellula lusitana]|uniref:PSD1 and planctomycete cytochrome C domain-containing protein n=1 Tax=Neorhodopirellula lusitana TaxID=445327 RepID=UPI00384C1900
MKNTFMSTCVSFASVLLGAVLPGTSAVADEVSFNRDIRPILSDRCYYCHGFDSNHREADLRLDIREEAEYVWDLDSPDDSELLLRITSDDPDVVMPPLGAHKEAITAQEAELIRRWIEQGAQYEPHWAFVAPERPKTEAIGIADAIDDFVGREHKTRGLHFAAEALPTKWLRRVALGLTGLPPTPERLEAFEEAVAEHGDAAYEQAVDQLLDSDAFGERMALEWLDVARYADTNGFQADAYRMNWPWRDWVVNAFNANMPFDQFTIEQLAGDLLVGDDGQGPSEDQLIATAFNRNHMINGEGGSIRAENLAKNNFDRLETTGTTWLGLTIGCCQCHDHKFDPLKQTDYFSMFSFFNQISETGLASKKISVQLPGQAFRDEYWVDKPFIQVGDEKLKKQIVEARKEAASIKKELDERRDQYVAEARVWVQEMRDDPALSEQRVPSSEYVSRFITNANLDNPKDNGFRQLIGYYMNKTEPWKDYQSRIAEAGLREHNLQYQVPMVMVMRDDQPRETFVLLRGNYETLGEKVSPTTPSFLPPLPEPETDRAPNRLTFAKWLVSEEQPLTSRVTVNRYWQLIFGRGLVSTPDDFGMQGALPSHPELLDWLAVEFREGGWDVKALLKGMVLSRTYRQTAIADRAAFEVDPSNEWLARGPRLRLDSRVLRDQALSLSGILNSDLGGPPVFPYQPAGVWESQSLGRNHYMRDDGQDLYRRSLYIAWRRVVAPTSFFDVPSRQVCSVTLQQTSTPLHALITLNDVAYVEAARVWAERLVAIPGDSERLSRIFFAATARHPEPEESALLQTMLTQARERFSEQPEEAAKLVAMGESPVAARLAAEEQAAWTTLCLAVLNLDETLCQ